MAQSFKYASVLGLLSTFVTASVLAEDSAEKGNQAIQLFQDRIMPIFRSEKPSSCVQCHLSSVDLKEYILPSHERTFLSLRDQGLVDLQAPRKSKILTLIKMGDRDQDAGARLIHAKTRQAEYEAFAAWIEACSQDPQLRDLPRLTPEQLARPAHPDAVIRHNRKSRVVDSFARNVWSQRMRCFPCHTPHEIDESNPLHAGAIKKHREFEGKYPDELVQRLKIFRETPEATLQYLIEKSAATPEGQVPLINLENPRESLLVLKPLSKLPPKDDTGKLQAPPPGDPQYHMGGLKMHPDDQSYKSFVTWLQDYSNVVGGRYTAVEDLPADNWFATQYILRLQAAPEALAVGTPMQLFVYSPTSTGSGWQTEPTAFTQGTVTPRKMVNGALFLLAPKGPAAAKNWNPEQAELKRGRYLVKVYADQSGRLKDDPSLLLGEEDFLGQVELPRARWRTGFRNAEVVFGTKLERP